MLSNDYVEPEQLRSVSFVALDNVGKTQLASPLERKSTVLLATVTHWENGSVSVVCESKCLVRRGVWRGAGQPGNKARQERVGLDSCRPRGIDLLLQTPKLPALST